MNISSDWFLRNNSNCCSHRHIPVNDDTLMASLSAIGWHKSSLKIDVDCELRPTTLAVVFYSFSHCHRCVVWTVKSGSNARFMSSWVDPFYGTTKRLWPSGKLITNVSHRVQSLLADTSGWQCACAAIQIGDWCRLLFVSHQKYCSLGWWRQPALHRNQFTISRCAPSLPELKEWAKYINRIVSRSSEPERIK